MQTWEIVFNNQNTLEVAKVEADSVEVSPIGFVMFYREKGHVREYAGLQYSIDGRELIACFFNVISVKLKDKSK